MGVFRLKNGNYFADIWLILVYCDCRICKGCCRKNELKSNYMKKLEDYYVKYVFMKCYLIVGYVILNVKE